MNNKTLTISKILLGLYFLNIGVALGGIALLGFAESTILNADALLRLKDFTQGITKYEQGIILADIIDKFRYVLIFVAIYVLSYESLSFRFQKSNFFVWILSILNTILMFLFCFFYAPKIVNIFNEEPKVMASPQAESLLNSAEITLKILFFTLIIAFFARIILTDKAHLLKLGDSSQKDSKDIAKSSNIESTIIESSSEMPQDSKSNNS
ncbi:DUF4149 domain-containing protein [Helicobacter saguini]|uniref:DUF4149 domain-containing protein n=1 Tax=Helicobacter saguini TaxID=1548018 RepID=UPI0007EC07D4|nr:DUF4149 domain-containing protein [Helicobacter saguini]